MIITSTTQFSWNPYTKELSFDARQIDTHSGKLQFMHELSHAALGHREDSLDNERAAWRLATEIAHSLNLVIPNLYISRRIREYE